VEPIQQTEGSKVDPERLVVKVVHYSPAEEVEPAVNGGGFDELDGEEDPPSDDVDLQ